MIKIFFTLAFICINTEQKKEDLMQKKPQLALWYITSP